MRILLKKLKKLPVVTKNSQKLGKIANLEINTSTHQVVKYQVRKKILLAKSPKLLIAPEQILEINNKKIIVEDNVESTQIKQSKRPQPRTHTAATLNSELEK
ncbi:MAG TPA: PRC-barrel domain-containing protein [Patescibacteria group bacterium]|nr:PRC-barrel domain-containing protein [Patescibacteria group bacterium]